MSIASGYHASFKVPRGRDFRSVLETPNSLAPIPGGPGDLLIDRLRFALIDAWAVLGRNDDLHDTPIRVLVDLHPRALTLTLSQDPEGELER